MHWDPREQAALREAGLSTDDLREASEAVADRVREDAGALESFFEREVVYSDMDQAHSAEQFPEHRVDGLDTYTHGADLRGWLRFETWGAYVEGGRALEADLVELELGPTVDARVRFAASRDRL